MFTSLLRCTVTASLFALAGCATAPPPAVVGQEAPKASFALADGGDIRLDGARGDVVVLAFFTTYCPSSRATLRAVDDLRARNAAGGLKVVAVNEGGTSSQVDELTSTLGVRRLVVAFDKDGFAAKELGLQAVPSIVVIDRHGTVRHVHPGFHGEDDRLAIEAEVSALLQETAPPTSDASLGPANRAERPSLW
jgi:peroxiredoxin